jgi:hypothetical protein
MKAKYAQRIPRSAKIPDAKVAMKYSSRICYLHIQPIFRSQINYLVVKRSDTQL